MTAAPPTLDVGALLDGLRGVRWPASQLVRAGLPGAHRAAQRGTSGDFTEFRSYRQGDDPRRIDWRLLARSDRAFVRVTDERAWWRTWIVVDASASMRCGDGDGALVDGSIAGGKWMTTCAIAIGLAAVAHATGDPVGLHIAMRPAVRTVLARTRRGTVEAIARALGSVSPAGAAPLAPVVSHVAAGCRLIVCTDGLGDTEALYRAIGQAHAAGSGVMVLHIVHPVELNPPAGVFLALDPEAPGERRTFAPSARVEYEARFTSFREKFARRVRAAGARYAIVNCADEPVRTVRRVIR